MADWFRPSDKLPRDGEIVNTVNSHGQVTQLKRCGRLWFVPDGSMYVYYEPTFWQPRQLEAERQGKGD